MGLHDVETMNLLTAACKAINPGIVIYGEPWDLDTPLDGNQKATQINGYKFEGYGQFNDVMRDAMIKGGLNSTSALGWVDKKTSADTADAANVVAGLRGFTGTLIEDPDKTVNYATCHDNYTLMDRFAKASTSFTFLEKMKMEMLANSLVFTSQGTSFMLAGEEFARTKNGDDNSYQSSYETNELDWSRLSSSVYQEMIEKYKKLIWFKQNVDGMHLDKTAAKAMTFNVSSKYDLISYEIKDTANNRTYKVVHGGASLSGATVDLSGYTLYLDTLNSNVSLTSSTSISAFQTIIAYK